MLNLSIVYVRALIVLSRLTITVRTYDAIPLTSSLRVLIMIKYLFSNSRFTLSVLVIRVSASLSVCISAPIILLNLCIFLLTCSRARLKKVFSSLNTARISYTGLRRFLAPVFIRVLITVSRSVIVIPIYAFIAERFVLKSIIIF